MAMSIRRIVAYSCLSLSMPSKFIDRAPFSNEVHIHKLKHTHNKFEATSKSWKFKREISTTWLCLQWHRIASYRSVGNSHEYICGTFYQKEYTCQFMYTFRKYSSVCESATRHMSLSKEIPSPYPYMYLGASLRVISMFPACINISLFGFRFFFFFFLRNCNIEDMSAYVFIPITTPATTIIIASCSVSAHSAQVATAVAVAASIDKVCKVHSLGKFLPCSYKLTRNVHCNAKLEQQTSSV